jgi:hypothetical protein
MNLCSWEQGYIMLVLSLTNAKKSGATPMLAFRFVTPRRLEGRHRLFKEHAASIFGPKMEAVCPSGPVVPA